MKMDIQELSDSGNDLEIASWQKRNHNMGIFAYRQFLIYGIIQSVIDIAVLIIVIFKRNRKEAFIILTPLLMLIGNVSCAIASYLMLNAE